MEARARVNSSQTLSNWAKLAIRSYQIRKIRCSKHSNKLPTLRLSDEGLAFKLCAVTSDTKAEKCKYSVDCIIAFLQQSSWQNM